MDFIDHEMYFGKDSPGKYLFIFKLQSIILNVDPPYFYDNILITKKIRKKIE